MIKVQRNPDEIIKELKKKGEVIPCINDRVFKSILEDKEMEGILSFIIVGITDLSEEEVYGNIKIVNSEEMIDNITNKRNSHDIKILINKNYILLEMNQSNYDSTKFRNTIHFHEGIVKNTKVADNYNDMGRVLQISFDNERPYSNELISTVMMMDVKNHIIDKAEEYFIKYYINLPKVRKLRYNINELSRLEKILLIITEKKKDILREISKGDKELELMVKKIEKLSEDPYLVSYFDEEKIEKIGKEMDIERAKEEGHSSGYSEGHSSGIKEEKIETAKKMKKDKLDIETIAKYTGLSKDEIENL